MIKRVIEFDLNVTSISFYSNGMEVLVTRQLADDALARLMDSKFTLTALITAQHQLLVINLKICHPEKAMPDTDSKRIKWWKLRVHKHNVLPPLFSTFRVTALTD